MSTLEEFEDAPLGATATHPDGRRAVGTFDYVEGRWYATDYGWYTDGEMAKQGYVLDPLPEPGPENSIDAFGFAWNLGHPVKEGQVIPDGTKWMKKVGGNVQESTMTRDYTVTANDTYILRTHEPLPNPLPDWLDAPAVLAAMDDCSWQKVWLPSRIGRWRCTCCGVDRHWSKMSDVTPLYPEGKKE